MLNLAVVALTRHRGKPRISGAVKYGRAYLASWPWLILDTGRRTGDLLQALTFAPIAVHRGSRCERRSANSGPTGTVTAALRPESWPRLSMEMGSGNGRAEDCC
jgi:hypothetical protein